MEDSEWIKLTACIEEAVVVAVVRNESKGKPGVRKPKKSILDRLYHEGVSAHTLINTHEGNLGNYFLHYLYFKT